MWTVRVLPGSRLILSRRERRTTGDLLWIAMVSCLLLSACTQVLYEGPRRPRGEVCTFDCRYSGKVGGPVHIFLLDHHSVDCDMKDAFEFLPGEHVVHVSFQAVGATVVVTGVSQFALRFTAVAGHVYGIEANASYDRSGGSWNPAVVDLGVIKK